jgi:hypothetical protein
MELAPGTAVLVDYYARGEWRPATVLRREGSGYQVEYPGGSKVPIGAGYIKPAPASSRAEMASYLFCPLSPRSTNLPVTVYARYRDTDGYRYGMTLAVGSSASLVMDEVHTLVAFTSDPVRVVQGPGLAPDLFARISAWVQFNRAALSAYWRGEVDGVGLARRLRQVPQPPAFPKRRLSG